MVEQRNVYVGHRYVPKIFGEWDKQETYEGLSIVTYQGASYTSKKRVPVGIDISNEEYWVVTGNYNAQIEEYRKEVKNSLDVMEKTKKEIGEKVSEIAVNVTDFGAKMDGITNDTVAIQAAIDFVADKGGGIVMLPIGGTVIDGSIHVKENVTLTGRGKNTTFYFKQTAKAGFIFYKKAKTTDFRASFLPDFSSDAFLFKSDYLSSTSDKASGIRSAVKNIEIWSSAIENTLNGTAIRFTSTGVGIWNIEFEHLYIRGFQTIINMETVGEGWVNGNVFRDITMLEFENCVVTKQSSQSRGIDNNLFDHLIIQCSNFSKDLFKDEDTSNFYVNTEIYDQKVFKQTRFGVVPSHKNTMQTRSIVQERIGNRVYNDGYYSIGRLGKGPANEYLYGTLRFKSGTDIDTEIKIGKDLMVSRKHFGTRILSKENLSFHYTKENDEIELYMKSSSDLDVSIFIVDSVKFTHSPVIRYATISNIKNIPLENDIDLHVRNNNYTRFSDGTLICKGIVEGTPTTLISDDEVTGIKALEGKNIDFPAEFSDVPVITTSSRREFLPISVGLKTVTSTGFTPVLYSNISNTEKSQIYSYIAIGKSK